MKYDASISRAFEDKKYLVKSLANNLAGAGARIWYDEFSLRPGDSLRKSIEKGLRESRYGIIVLSKAFFEKFWTNAEFDVVFSLASQRHARFTFPLWHKVSFKEVQEFSPMLSMRFGVDTKNKSLLQKILREIRPDLSSEVDARANPTSFAPHLISNPYMSKEQITQSKLLQHLSVWRAGRDWKPYVGNILTCYGMVNLKFISGLGVIYKDEFCNEVLNSVYQRILNREVDEVGQITYLPFIFLQGSEGVRRVESFLLASDEYRRLQ